MHPIVRHLINMNCFQRNFQRGNKRVACCARHVLVIKTCLTIFLCTHTRGDVTITCNNQ